MKSWPLWLVAVIAAVLFCSYAGLLILSNWPLTALSLEKAGQLGDSFGIINAFFTGGAFLLILWTIVIQQRELSLQQKEMSRMVALQYRNVHMDTMRYAIDNPELAVVWGERYQNLDNITLSQYMYVNLIFAQWFTLYDEEIMSKETAESLLRIHMHDSKYFRKYWNVSEEIIKEYPPAEGRRKEFYEIASKVCANWEEKTT